MQTNKIIQAVILMLILAMAASCTAGRQYSSKVFGPRTSPVKDSTATTVRFLQTEEDSTDMDGIILTKRVTTADSSVFVIPAITRAKTPADSLAPVVRSGNKGGVRTKRTRDDQ